MTPNGIHGDKRVWPSLETASAVASWANLFLILSLGVGVLSTALIVWMADVKESYWDIDRRAAEERIAQLNNETARLRDASAANAEATLATAQAGRANALAAQSMLATAQVLAIAQGLITKERAGEAARCLYIVSKVAPFAGKQFDITSSDIALETLRGSLTQALKLAGWIETDRSDAGADHERQSSIGGAALIKIHVDATISELSEAAETLASALNAEGIAAMVISKTETDSINANVIHILISPKP